MEDLIEGCVVHYVPPNGFNRVRAAVVTHVWSKEDGCVNLFIFPDGTFGIQPETPTSVKYDPAGQPGTWHWIAKPG